MRSVRQIATIASNQLMRLMRDGSSLGWLVILPILIIFVLGITVQGLFSPDFAPAHPYRVAVTDGSSEAQQRLTSTLRSQVEFFDVVSVSASEARRLVLEQEVDAAVLIPHGFPEEAPVVVAEPGAAVAQILAEFIGADRWSTAALDTSVQLAHTEVAGGARDADAESSESPWQGLSAFQYYSGGMTVMFVMFAARGAMMFAAGDRVSGAYARVRSFGVTRGTYLIAGFTAAVMIGFVFIGMMTGITRLLFGVAWGDLLPWLALTVVTATAMASLSFVLASVVTKPNSLEQLGNTTFTILAMLGGSSIPLVVLPLWLTSALAWLPSRMALEGYFRLFNGATIGNLSTELATLGATTFALFTLGWVISNVRARGEV